MKRTLFAKGAEQTFHFRFILLREDVPLMIGNDAAVPKGFEIFIPKLAVWQAVDKSKAGVAADLVQEFAAGFPAARIDEEKPPFAIQRGGKTRGTTERGSSIWLTVSQRIHCRPT